MWQNTKQKLPKTGIKWVFFDIKCESFRVKKSIRSFWKTWKRLNKNICLSSFLKNESYIPGWYIWFFWHCFTFSSVIAISFDANSCMFKLRCFNWSNSFVWYPFPSLNWVLKLSLGTVSHVEIMKRCTTQNNLFGQQDHSIEFNDSFRFWVRFIPLYSYLWNPFFFVTLSQFPCFFRHFETDFETFCNSSKSYVSIFLFLESFFYIDLLIFCLLPSHSA